MDSFCTPKNIQNSASGSVRYELFASSIISVIIDTNRATEHNSIIECYIEWAREGFFANLTQNTSTLSACNSNERQKLSNQMIVCIIFLL
jgi:hypothetical protein